MSFGRVLVLAAAWHGLALLATAPVLAAEPAVRVLVQRVEAVSVDGALARSLEDALVFELARRANVDVVSPAELEQTIDFARTQSELGCDMLDSCLAEVRKKLRVDVLVAGKIARLGSELIMTFGAIDLRTHVVGARIAHNAADLRSMLVYVPSAVDSLLGRSPPKPAFKLGQGARLRLAVMPLSARGVAGSVSDAMTQILAVELSKVEGVSVISRDDLRAMLDKAATEGELGCNASLECLIDIGAALGLSKLVAGTVGKVRDTHVISMQLIDVRHAEVENRVLETFDGDVDELKHAVKLSAYRLVGADFEERHGNLEFLFNASKASGYFGDRAIQIRDNRLVLKDVEPGRYSLRVIADADQYFPFQTDVYVVPSSDIFRSINVSERPARWYGKWWVWSIVGAVAVSTTVALVVLAGSPPTSGTGEVSFRVR